MRVAAAILALVVAGSACPAVAQETPLPKGLTCKFETGNVYEFAQGRFAPKPAGAYAFEIVDIDLSIGIAMLKGPEATSPLKIVRAIGAHHFIEVSSEGFLNLTTVYDPPQVTDRYPAAHSRHFGVLGEPLISQFAGSCAAKS